MYDAGKILVGLAVFLCAITSPVWYVAAQGGEVSAPELEISTEVEQCVEPVSYMRSSHMRMLLDWRETVVREGVRTYTASDGSEYEISLTGTCLDCHQDKSVFCDRCHNYLGKTPACWNCHISPE
jgi:hypothetical protein